MKTSLSTAQRHAEAHYHLIFNFAQDQFNSLSPDQEKLLPSSFYKIFEHVIEVRGQIEKLNAQGQDEIFVESNQKVVALQEEMILRYLATNIEHFVPELKIMFRNIVEIYEHTQFLIFQVLGNTATPKTPAVPPRTPSRRQPTTYEQIDQSNLQHLIDYFKSLNLPISSKEDFQKLDMKLKHRIRRQTFEANLGKGIFQEEAGESLESVMNNQTNRHLAIHAFAEAYDLSTKNTAPFFAHAAEGHRKRAKL